MNMIMVRFQTIFSSNTNKNSFFSVENVYKYVSQLSTESPPPAKRSKMLVDYDIDSIDEWELRKKRAGDGETLPDEDHAQMPKITVSKDLFEIGSKLNSTAEAMGGLSDSDRLLAQSIINHLASAAALQKSSTS